MIRIALVACVATVSSALPALAEVDVRIASGESVYRQYCASCHGAKAEGAPNWKRPDENGELPSPPHDASGHTWRHSDTELVEMIAKGWRDPFNKTERLTMPPFDEQLTPREIEDVIAYLKTLWTDEQRQFQAEENHDRPLAARENDP